MTALLGIRVLDLSRLLPGPFATLVLSDLGARVDKLEDPDTGDYARNLPPLVDGMGAAFHALNRGKRSLALDLARPEGARAFLRLVGRYDVVLEQFRPGVLERLGLGHDRILGANPRLVVAALTGYGQTGPLRDRAGHDIDYIARAGILGLQGPPGDRPQVPGFQLADVSGGLFAAIGVLSALYERERTGQGKILDVAMLDSVLPFATITLGRLLGGELPLRGGELLTGGIAAYDTYVTKDGEAVAFGALEPKFLTRFCAATGLEAFAESALVPGAHQQDVKQAFARVFASKNRSEWEVFNAAHDCCIEPVLRPDELAADPQIAARGLFFRAGEGVGPTYYRTPVTPPSLRPAAAPAYGEHTDEILQEAGFTDTDIDLLRQKRAIR